MNNKTIYEKIESFFENVWLDNCNYKVLMTPKIFNLHFLFADKKGAYYNDNYKIDGIMSDTALLLCAEELATFYKYNNCFPKILLTTDVIYDGCDIKEFIKKLENLLLEIAQKNGTGDYYIELLPRALNLAIYIYPIACGDFGEYRSTKECYSRKELHEISQYISNLLQENSIANTTTALSVELPYYFLKEEYNHCKDSNKNSFFQYRGNILNYYYKNTQDMILETVRIYYHPESNSYNTIATSQVIFNNLSERKLNELCRYLAYELENNNVFPTESKIINILQTQKKELLDAKAELLSCLLSILSFFDFCHAVPNLDEDDLYRFLIESNYYKLAANFDKIGSLNNEFMYLFGSVWYNKHIKNDIFNQLKICLEASESRPLLETNSQDNIDTSKWLRGIHDTSSKEIYEKAEDLFSEVGYNGVYDYYHTKAISYDYLKLSQYLKIMKRDGINELSSIGTLLNIVDSGLIDLTLKYDKNDTIEYITATSEFTCSILPRRYFVLIRALTKLEEYFPWYNKKQLEKLAREFFSFLKQDFLPPYNEDSEIFSKPISVLSFLYVSGLSFKDWDFELLTERDYLSHGINDLEEYSARQQQIWEQNLEIRKGYYNNWATSFFWHKRQEEEKQLSKRKK